MKYTRWIALIWCGTKQDGKLQWNDNFCANSYFGGQYLETFALNFKLIYRHLYSYEIASLLIVIDRDSVHWKCLLHKASRHQDTGWRKHLHQLYKRLHQLSYYSKLRSIRTQFLCALIRGGRIMICWICDVGLPIFRQLNNRHSVIYVNGNVMYPIYVSLATPEVVKTTISVATRDGMEFVFDHMTVSDVGIEPITVVSFLYS